MYLRLLTLLLLLALCGCSTNGGISMTNVPNIPTAVLEAKETLLAYQTNDETAIKEALSVLESYEEAVYSEYDRIGEDRESSGFFQVYTYAKIGVRIQKKDSLLITVEQAKSE